MESWLKKAINSSRVLEGHEVGELVELINTGAWDAGAVRTLHAYYQTDRIGLDEVLVTFYFKYNRGGWVCRNCSACIVALTRELSYKDF